MKTDLPILTDVLTIAAMTAASVPAIYALLTTLFL
jgi:hypothetical protein